MGCSSSIETNFINRYKNLEMKKEIIIENVNFSKQPYFDILEKLSRNNIVEEFTFRNVDICKFIRYFILIYFIIMNLSLLLLLLIAGNTDKFLDLMTVLMHKKKLRYININSLSNIGNFAGKSLIAFLNKNGNILLDVSIIDVDFLEDDFYYICEIPFYLISVIKLEIKEIFFKNNDYKINFFKNMIKLTSLKEIVLEKMDIVREYCTYLFESLSKLSNLELINLSNNAISSDIVDIKDVLNNNPNLRCLLLNNCHLGDYEIRNIEDALTSNSSIEILEMNINIITDASSEILHNILSKNNVIKQIYMLKNKINYRDIKNKFKYSLDLNRLILEE